MSILRTQFKIINLHYYQYKKLCDFSLAVLTISGVYISGVGMEGVGALVNPVLGFYRVGTTKGPRNKEGNVVGNVVLY